MGQYLHLELLPLSRSLRGGGHDSDAAWQLLGLDDWARLPAVRATLEQHPQVLGRVRGEFRRGFEPPGTLDLRILTSFASGAMDAHDVSPNEWRTLHPFRRISFVNATGYVVGWVLFFAPKLARRLGRDDGRATVPQYFTLHGVEVRTDDLESADWVPSATLQGTDLDALRREVESEDPRDLETYGWTIDPILDALREARSQDLDVIATFG